MNLLNGMISFMLMTFLRYVVARFSGIFLIAWAASRVFYIGTFKLGNRRHEVCGVCEKPALLAK